MIFSTHIILQNLAALKRWIEMAFLQKLLKRKPENKKEKTEPHETYKEEYIEKDTKFDRFSTISNSDSESDDEYQKEALMSEMKRHLKSMK